MTHLSTRLHTIGRWTLALSLALFAPCAAHAQAADYRIGPQDILAITVFDQPALGGKYAVEIDGSFSFPLLGRMRAGGFTMRDLESALTTELGNGYFKNPQVTVVVDQYRSQRVFIVGEVRNAGTYALTGDMTLIEALAKAGSATPTAGDEVIITRAKSADGQAGPVVASGSDVVRVNLRNLQRGASSVPNIELRDGDTVFVPRAELVFVYGQVKNPGSYPVPSGTTALQALSLAGGTTQYAATGRLKVIRVEGDSTTELRIKLSDIVRPGDTIVVPERYF
jgi:polysaccharide export outer membrane protein